MDAPDDPRRDVLLPGETPGFLPDYGANQATLAALGVGGHRFLLELEGHEGICALALTTTGEVRTGLLESSATTALLRQLVAQMAAVDERPIVDGSILRITSGFVVALRLPTWASMERKIAGLKRSRSTSSAPADYT